MTMSEKTHLRRNPIYWIAIALLIALMAPPVGLNAEQDEESRWERSISAFEERDKESPPPPGAILFVGSSSIAGWDVEKYFPDLQVINRGFGGSQIADSVEFADRIIIPYEPKTIVFYAGDNDIAAGKSPEEVAADYRALVEKIHAALPDTRILFVCIKASTARWAMADKMRETNMLIKRYIVRSRGYRFETSGVPLLSDIPLVGGLFKRTTVIVDQRLDYVDVFNPMLGKDGQPRPELLVDDGLHLTPEGYELWSEILRPYLEDED